ncbi:MAG: GTP cyclohydrolase I FolE [Spirochaetales bacterium]|nr:GTP cyclohydrolase I FolE [Spirochaetales bacterium]MBR2316998.1 GTP cyclohydrolase I FolE [Spirochaetales bacterium]
MEDLITQIITQIGEDSQREGLLKTPKRAAKALKFLTKGYDEKLEDIINGAVFHAEDNEMVVIRDIEFYSLCEHHMLPFYGKCHIGYIPNKSILGLSKFARITDHFARRLQVQERLTTQIADAVQEILQPLGVGVTIEASHLCMMMRGVQKQNSFTITNSLRGVFKSDVRTRNEFLRLIR